MYQVHEKICMHTFISMGCANFLNAPILNCLKLSWLLYFLPAECMTTIEGEVGPMKGVACIFPFIHKGKTYTGCAPDQGACHWCSTKIDENGVHINGQGFYGCCNHVCPKEDEKGKQII